MTSTRSFGHYELERVLGTGSFATVWLARDEVLDRHVAIKILADNWSRDLDVHRRFLSEARVLLTAESRRITRGFELGDSEDGHPYLVMTWADRGTLDDRIDERRSRDEMFAVHEMAAIVREIALALADVHGLGHLHRDVKPSNVLIRSGGSSAVAGLEPDEQVLIGDFGLARSIDSSAITLVAGSPGYVAPEQAAGLTQLDRRADLYSLGRIALELLTGDPGGRATTMAAAAAERVDAHGQLDECGVTVPHDVLLLIERLVAVDADDRPATALEVADALEPFTDPAVALLATPAPPRAPAAGGGPGSTGSAPETTRLITGRRSLYGVLAVALVAAAVFAIVRVVDDGGGGAEGGGGTTVLPASSTSSDARSTSGSLVTIALPERANVRPEASDDTRTVATVLLDVEEVVAYFSSLPAPWRLVGEPERSEDEARLTLTDGQRDADVRIEPVAETAVTPGQSISQITIDYRS